MPVPCAGRDGVGRIGTMVNAGDLDALAREFAAHPAHEPREIRLGIEAAGDAGRLGDDEDREMAAGKSLRQRKDAFDETTILDTMEIAAVLVDDAVAVEDERAPTREACMRHGGGP